MLAAMAAFRAGACAVEAAGASMELNRHATPPITNIHTVPLLPSHATCACVQRFVSFSLH